jgi:hypothetical protein
MIYRFVSSRPMSAPTTTKPAPTRVVFSRKSDLTLVSSDGVHFLVSSAMMSEASEVFDGMLAIPQPTTSSSRGTTITIDLPEDAETMEILLSWIYPSNRRPQLRTFAELAPLVLVARKYDVTLDALRSMLRTAPIIEPDPLLAYIFCVRHDFLQEGRAAGYSQERQCSQLVFTLSRTRG